MAFEDDYLDVMQNIEFAIVAVYHQEPQLVDYDVSVVLDALIRGYQAELQEKQPPEPRLTELREGLYEAVTTMCEFRLGRSELVSDKTGQQDPAPPSITVEEIVACLKRIRKSVQRWTKQGGRRGYLTFIDEFIV